MNFVLVQLADDIIFVKRNTTGVPNGKLMKTFDNEATAVGIVKILTAMLTSLSHEDFIQHFLLSNVLSGLSLRYILVKVCAKRGNYY